MNANVLTDFLRQENIGLEVRDDPDTGHREYLFQEKSDDRWLFVWRYGSFTVDIWTLDNENVDCCFTMNNQSLSDVLKGIKSYRTVAHS